MKETARVALVGPDGRRVVFPLVPERLSRTRREGGEQLGFAASLDDRLERGGVETARAASELGALAGEVVEVQWGSRRFTARLSELSISETEFAEDLRPIAATIELALDVVPEERAVAVVVAGERWRAVPDLREAGPNDRVYEARLEDDGSMSLRFGDGRHGARPPRGGQVDVRSRYRVGEGEAGEKARP